MLVEQIRYFVSSGTREEVVALRRRIDNVRHNAGLPAGTILLADEDGDDCPQIVWQCAYADEAELGHVDTQLIGNSEYEELRATLGATGARVELELYTVDEAD